MLWKAKICAALVFLGLSAVAIGLAFRLPPIYRAETLILVDSQKIPEKFVSATVVSDTQDRLATISQRVLSSTQLKKIIEDFNLYSEQRKTRTEEEILEKIRADIDIKLERGWTGGRPGAFRIAYQGSSPAVVADVTNRLGNLFIDENLRTREVQAEGTTEFIENQLQDAKRTLDTLEKSVSDYKVRHNGELPEQENSLSGTLARLSTELQGNQDATNRAQQSKAMIETSLSIAETAAGELARAAQEAASPGAKAGRTLPVPGAPAARKRSEVLEEKLDQMRAHYRDSHPDVRALQQAIAQAKRQEEEEERLASVPPAAPDSPATEAPKPFRREPPALIEARQRVTALRAQLKLATDELRARQADRERILREIARYQARLEKLPVREQEMAALLRDYEVSKANYKALFDKKIAAEMASDMEKRQKAERFTVVDPARTPEKPSKPNRPLFAGIGCALAVALALAVSIGKEIPKGVFLGEWELPEGVVVLSRVPALDEPARRNGWRRWWVVLGIVAVALVLLAAAAGYWWYRQA